MVHEEMRLITEAFQELAERLGMERGNACTECEDGFYNNDHCTACFHEQYQ